MKSLSSLALTVLLLALRVPLDAAEVSKAAPATKLEVRQFSAQEVFDVRHKVIFQDDFRSGQFGRWHFSENDNYNILHENPDRIKIMDAPALGAGHYAARFAVQRAPNSFRSEISLPHESGFQERWYGERIFIPADWVFDPTSNGVDIVMQWHAVRGNWRPTFPNLEISIGNTNWFIRQSFGSAQTKPTRTERILDEPVQRGSWVSWVVHVKWSAAADGCLQIWKDGNKVVDLKGVNVYTTIGEAYTPYLKTGIYHPFWHLDRSDRRDAFYLHKPVATNKVIFVSEVKIGNEHAEFKDVAPGKM